MPRGNRDERASSVDWTFPLIGLLLAISIAWGVGYLQSRETEHRYHTPKSYQESAKANAERACVGLEPTALLECVNEQIESGYQQANAEQDLKAQQRAASSALIAAFVSFLALIATGVGIYYVRETLRATLKAVEDTGKATAAMEEQNSIARDAQRPWISATCQVTKFERQADTVTIDYAIVFTNIGKTIAYDAYCTAKTNVCNPKTINPIVLIMRRFDKAKADRVKPCSPLIPGEASTTNIRSTFSFYQSSDDPTGRRLDPVSVTIVAAAYYKSARNKEWHETEISFLVAGPDQFDMVVHPTVSHGALTANELHVRRYISGDIS